MSNYQTHWDLTTIPEPEFNSEHGRRRRAKAPHAPNQALKPCEGCGLPLNSTERRKPCHSCGHKHKRSTA